MITIIHGEDVAKSRKYFIDQKSQYQHAVSLQGQSVTLTEIMQTLEGNELFSSEKYIFIEEFFSKRKPSKEIDEIIKVINQNHTDATIYFWESKDITPKQQKQFTTATIKQFKVPQTVFAFLDAIKPHNGQLLIKLFHQTLQDEEAQFIFAMIIRQFRLLLACSGQTETPIEELKRIAPWQKGKLEKQAKSFPIEILKENYNKLFQLEYGVKTGNLSMPLEPTIDFFLIDL